MVFGKLFRREIFHTLHCIQRLCSMSTVCKFFCFCGMALCTVVRSWFGYHSHFIMVFGHSFLTSEGFMTIKTLDSSARMFTVMILLDNSRVVFLMAIHAGFACSLSDSA